MYSPTEPLLEAEVLQKLKPQQDLSAQQRSLEFIESVKCSTNGWEKCIASLTDSAVRSHEFRFFCLQVIEHFVANQYQSTNEEQCKIREFLGYWIRTQCEPRSDYQTSCICNKAAQIFATVFVRDYPAHWDTFFDDLVTTLSLGPGAVDCFLRVLLAINDEINSDCLSSDLKHKERNNTIKTAMKETAVKLLVESWYQILKVHLTTDRKMVSNCFKVIGAYVSWIDIHLIADDRFIQPVVTATTSKELRESAVLCLLEIAKKGMHPAAKIHLIDMVLAEMHKSNVLDAIDDETDFTCKMATLANAIGLNLFEGLSVISKSDTPEQVKTVYDTIESKIIPVMLNYLHHENKTIVTAITPFIREYILMLKTKPLLTEVELGHVQNILVALVFHMQYSDSCNFDLDGMNEVEFDKYRKLLKVIFINLVSLNSNVLMEFTRKYVQNSLNSWRCTSFQKPEVALLLMYYIGEAIPGPQQSQWFLSEPPTPSHMQKMMRTLMSSTVSEHTHPQVNEQYFKTAVRFAKFFDVEPQHLPLLLEVFFDHRGLKHCNSKVRYCCCNQFVKLVKTLPRSHLNTYTVDMLQSLKGIILVCFPERDTDTAGGDASQRNQLNLYEAAGVIIASSSFPSVQKAGAFRELLSSPFRQFSDTLAKLYVETDRKRYETLETDLVHQIDVTKRTSNVFTNLRQLMSSSCVDMFMHSVQLFIPCLQLPQSGAKVKTSVCQFLHRMVICLEENVLPYLPQATEGMFKAKDVTAIQEYIPLLVQIINKFKKGALPFLEQNIKPIVHSIFSVLDCPMDENDEHMRREKMYLYRCYFTLIYTIASHGIIIDTLNAQDGPFMDEVKNSVLRGASEMSNPDAQRTCFAILRMFVLLWADINEHQFIDFIYRNIVPNCFIVPMNLNFDLDDATCTLVLWEIATCMRTVYEKRGNELINFLQNDDGKANVSQENMNTYCVALVADVRQFKSGLKQFFVDARK